MSFIVDRRKNAKNKSAVNRQRFIARYRRQVKRAVNDAVARRGLRDIGDGESVTIPADDVSEPVFGHGQGGRRTSVHPGNKEFVTGDHLRRPNGGAGQGGGPSDSGEGDDEFVFELTRAEFMDCLFEGLALPNLIKRSLNGEDAFKFVRAGFTSDGLPTKLNVLRSVRAAKARRIALSGRARRRLREVEEALLVVDGEGDGEARNALHDEARRLRARIARVPYLDTVDLRYNLHVKQPQPTSKAVMFCLMDVSGSMDQSIKDLAKRFFLLLYLFLERHYERTEIVFIRHHTTAKEVDEQEFFYSRETGGTVVSSALKLMAEIQSERYDPEEWNIYGAQASDGDNWNDDSPRCRQILAEQILPVSQYFTYVEITRREPQSLWHEYTTLEAQSPQYFARRRVAEEADVFPVFRELFERGCQHQKSSHVAH